MFGGLQRQHRSVCFRNILYDHRKDHALPVCILADWYPQPLARIVHKPSDATTSTSLEENGRQVQQLPGMHQQQQRGAAAAAAVHCQQHQQAGRQQVKPSSHGRSTGQVAQVTGHSCMHKAVNLKHMAVKLKSHTACQNASAHYPPPPGHHGYEGST